MAAVPSAAGSAATASPTTPPSIASSVERKSRIAPSERSGTACHERPSGDHQALPVVVPVALSSPSMTRPSAVDAATPAHA